ncbi:16S rRNA (guanine(527)-N(7))-methyltransferase RsmG [Galbitalea sp. SE-J8]|uniref:16S rRNA (guanine(527)-N(7))-methyltransferase RsmG n=1 Tax=Galbitalea sp. SE-J8 TaxID=3054952 RepID=UPI00259D2A7F|nr:16S rRNA (guanine(527)-N(7))-methyltransferase RsmG [Galbitalea sp. SE-J8]MDM4762345.1 16S rRNA (guanine(527)-N(7))-methyltransferase RsmG [Galbitalea sp. SE-J8]
MTDPSTAGALEAEPPAASVVFGDRTPVARAYVAHLREFGELLGLIGPQELPRLWTRHVVNSALLAPLLPDGAHVADVGSGAGLPGLVLAIARPDTRLTLIEPMERRTEWLAAERDRLGLDNVTVLRGRAQEVRLDEPADVVTARAVSALKTLIPITRGLVRPGGTLLFLKGERVHDEVAAAEKEIRRARLADVEVLTLGADLGPEVTRVFRATVN